MICADLHYRRKSFRFIDVFKVSLLLNNATFIDQKYSKNSQILWNIITIENMCFYILNIL